MIYLDNNATTQIHARVLEAMMPYFKSEFGNPSSKYPSGNIAQAALGKARESLAETLQCTPEQIVFTSCATEANNAAILSAIRKDPAKNHIISSVIEHSSVINLMKGLEEQGFFVTYLPVDSEGGIDLAELRSTITPSTALVSLMWANNETGVIWPIEEINQICKAKGVLLHTDAVQALGKLEFSYKSVSPDYVTLSAHKIHGPKGVGALVLKDPLSFKPFIVGGGQERGLRSGTENVPSIVGFGEAAKLINIDNMERVTFMRNLFEEKLSEKGIEHEILGKSLSRLPNTSCIWLKGIDSDYSVNALAQKGIYVSSGSACKENSITHSHVVEAMLPKEPASSEFIRVSLSSQSTLSELKHAIEAISQIGQLSRKGR